MLPKLGCDENDISHVESYDVTADLLHIYRTNLGTLAYVLFS